MNNVIPLEEYRPHLSGQAKCLHCKHEWLAVSPVGVYAGLECPECHLVKGIRAGLVYPSEMMFTCFCGCYVFSICRDRGPMCLNCGEITKGDGI